MIQELAPIPVVDIRAGGTLHHARDGKARARALRQACLAWFPRLFRALLPLLDVLAKRWFVRSSSPYVEEIRAIAAALGVPGVWFLNGSYQWCCTALACEEDDVPWLLRTLDWPFPGLGRHVEIAHMQGTAGEFYNVTWPGYVGALTALAPGRFAVAINQGPMRRRTQSRWLRLFDLALNALGTLLHRREMPPDQLLRRAMETCRDFAEARRMLESAPLARPAIYTLVGCAAGERCVIERTEQGARTHTHETAAANDWLSSSARWEGRIGGGRFFFALSFDAAAENNRARRQALLDWRGSPARDAFAWVAPPVLNPFTRVAVELCPAKGLLRVMGYETPSSQELPRPATQPLELTAAHGAMAA